MSQTPPGPVGDVSGDDSGGRRCPVCGSALTSARACFCSGRCRMRAHRRRHQPPATVARTGTFPATWPQVYECPECDQHYIGVRRCPDCNLFARRLGPGGLCTHCDEPVLLADLLERGVGP